MHTDTSLSQPYFNVLTGRHAGACVPLDNTVCRVGAGPACDLILGDGVLAAEHFVLRLSRGYVTIEATGGDVVIDAGTRLPLGSGCRFRLPVDISVNDLHMRIAYPGGRVPQTPAMTQRFGAMASMAAVGAALLGLYFFAGWGNNEAFASRLPQAWDAAARVPVPIAPVAAVARPDAAGALQARLAQDGLGQLHIAVDGAYVHVTGQADAAGMVAWGRIQRWFDGTYGSTHVLGQNIRPPAALAMPTVKLRAVWMGADPYVIGDKGDRLYPGAAIADGWVLSRIEPRGVVFAKNGSEYTFTL